jgi:hypothetical protein
MVGMRTIPRKGASAQYPDLPPPWALGALPSEWRLTQAHPPDVPLGHRCPARISGALLLEGCTTPASGRVLQKSQEHIDLRNYRPQAANRFEAISDKVSSNSTPEPRVFAK